MSEYKIRPGYKSRLEPEYFQDTMSDGLMWQPDTYKIAAYLARLMKRQTLVDFGCGRAHKLIQYGSEFRLVGVDHGENIQWCNDHYPGHTWVDFNLDQYTGLFRADYAKDAVIICTDVIEHLVKPMGLVEKLLLHVRYAPIVFTTPNRLRSYGYDHDGEPTNPSHVREWTLPEMIELMKMCGLPITWAGYTASEDGTFHKNTMLLLLGLDAPYAQSVEQAFDVEVAR